MTTPAPAPRTTASGRLGNGELRRQVAAWLEANPGPHTPGEIAKELNRSAGAVGNALTTLADRGEATREPGKPARYRANPATAAAAATGAVARPAPPRAPVPKAPPSAPPPAPPTAAPAAVTRPNGQVYHTRALADMPDTEALRKLRAAGVPALLYGPPGTGKTSLVEAAFPEVITVAGDGDTTVGDFLGEYTQRPDGTYEWVNGPLIRAMTEGKVLFIDDATLISPAVLAVVYPAMDGRREITVKAHKGEVIKAAPGFYVIGGHNPGVHGAVLTEALSSRFSVQVQVSTDYDLARSLKIDSRAITAARNLATRQANGEIGWSPQLRELLAFQKVAGILGLDAAIGNLIGVAPEEDRDVVAKVVTTTFGKPAAPLALAGSSDPPRPRPRPSTGKEPPMTAYPPAAPAAPARAAGAWLKFSAAMTAQVPPISGRADLTVTAAPGAGHGHAACFTPATATIEINGSHLPVDPATADPARPSDRERYPALWGAVIHECAHAAHTSWQPPKGTSPAWAEAPWRWRNPASSTTSSPAAPATAAGCAPAPGNWSSATSPPPPHPPAAPPRPAPQPR